MNDLTVKTFINDSTEDHVEMSYDEWLVSTWDADYGG